MLTDLFLAIAHHLLVFALTATLVAEAALLRLELVLLAAIFALAAAMARYGGF